MSMYVIRVKPGMDCEVAASLRKRGYFNPLSAANPVHPERRHLDRPDRTDFFRIFVFRISRAFAVRVLL